MIITINWNMIRLKQINLVRIWLDLNIISSWSWLHWKPIQDNRFNWFIHSNLFSKWCVVVFFSWLVLLFTVFLCCTVLVRFCVSQLAAIKVFVHTDFQYFPKVSTLKTVKAMLLIVSRSCMFTVFSKTKMCFSSNKTRLHPQGKGGPLRFALG